jgi:small subunit ribosomal protein S16
VVIIRLKRMGAKQKPFYRIVVADSKRAPTGRFIENVGHYNPNKEPYELKVDLGRVEHWIKHGAQMSNTVKNLVKKAQAVSKQA